MLEYLLVQGHVGLDALDHNLGQCVSNTRESRIAIVAVCNQLADHRVIKRRYPVAAVNVAVDADAGSAG